jgi:outer membrane receptor protein involved in Fe transport
MRSLNSHRRSSAHRALLLIGGAVVPLLAAPALAQESPAAEAAAEPEAGEIIVTASRREETLTNVAASVSVIRNDRTLAIGITDINGIADLVPNLQATDGGSPNLGNLTIRGVFTGGSPTVATYVDDVPYGPVLGGAGTSLALDGSLLDLERIEVNRGPQGTLFGAGAMAGAVRYITRQPDLNDIGGYAFADVSFTDDGDPNYLTRGRLSAPIVEDKLAVAVSGFYNEAGGYIDHPLRNAKNVDGWQFWGGQISLLAKPTERLTLKASAVHQQAEFDNASYVGFNPTTGETILGDLTDITQIASPRTYNFDLYNFTGEYDLDFATLTSVTSWQSVEFTTFSDITPQFGPLADLFAPAGAPHTVTLFAPFDTRRFSQEVRLTSEETGKFEWIIGGYYTNQRTDQVQRALVVPDDIDLLDVSSPLKYREYAAFANATFYVTPDWDITGGIRVADNRTEVRQQVGGLLVPPSFNAPVNINNDTVTTYLFNTRYRISPSVNLYARAASGYRPGGSNLVTAGPGGQPLGQPTFEADNLWTYEAGIKGSTPDGVFSYGLAAYFLRWKDAQVSFVQVNGLGGTTNAEGGINGQGVEGIVTAKPFAGFELTATFAVTDTELQSAEPTLGAAAGTRLPNVPDVSGSILADYGFPLSDSIDATLGATWRYTGSFLTTYSPTLPAFELGDFSQFDLRAGLDFGQITVNAYVTNLANERAFQTVFPVAATYAQGVVLRPRTFGVNARVEF